MTTADAAHDILAHGTDLQREALEAFAVRLRDVAVALDMPGEVLPGLGPRPAPEDVTAALVRNEERLWAARSALYADALPYPEAAERLGVSKNQITNLVRSGDLLAIDGPDGLRLPAWQFHPETRRGRLDGIRRVAEAFPGRVLGLSSWMEARHQALDGRTAAEALADGDVELVVAVAATQA